MAKRNLDPEAIDRAAAIASGNTPENKNEPEPGELELTAPVAAETEVPVGEQPVAAEEPAAEPEAPAPKTVHNARQAIIHRAKAKRLEEAGEPEPVLEAEPAPIVAQPVAPQTRKVKVDRVEREVSQEEYDTAARVGLALGNRLTEINQLLPQIRELAKQPATGNTPPARDSRASPPQDSAARRPPSRVAAITDEKLDQIGEQLAYGEPEDRRAALRALAEEIGGGQAPISVEEVAAELQRRNARDNEVAAAGSKFAERHPTIAHDQRLRRITADLMHETALEEMRAIGVEPRFLEQAAANPQVAFIYHGDLLRQGFQLSDAETLADTAARTIAQSYQRIGQAPQHVARPTPTALTPSTQRQITPAANRADRELEKENMRQPRRAAMVARTPPAPAARPREEVIRDMRKQRGYSTA